MLVDAAVESGAEFQEGLGRRPLIEGGTVAAFAAAGGGAIVIERARIVIGADGLR